MKKSNKIVIISCVSIVCVANIISTVIWKEELLQYANLFTAISGWVSGIATIILGYIAISQNKRYKEENDEFTEKQADLIEKQIELLNGNKDLLVEQNKINKLDIESKKEIQRSELNLKIYKSLITKLDEFIIFANPTDFIMTAVKKMNLSDKQEIVNKTNEMIKLKYKLINSSKDTLPSKSINEKFSIELDLMCQYMNELIKIVSLVNKSGAIPVVLTDEVYKKYEKFTSFHSIFSKEYLIEIIGINSDVKQA